MPIRAAVYYDGFNLYHALDALQRPHLKWLNLRAVAEKLILQADEVLVRTVTCTAIRTDNVDKMLRHRAYLAVLEAAGVDCLKGHFIDDEMDCRQCGSEWAVPVEKQGDVNLALAIIDDAHRDIFDKCYLVTVDGDQIATAKLLRQRFPEKTIISVAPPGRQHNRQLLAACHGPCTVKPADLQLCLFGATEKTKDRLIIRPAEYNP